MLIHPPPVPLLRKGFLDIHEILLIFLQLLTITAEVGFLPRMIFPQTINYEGKVTVKR